MEPGEDRAVAVPRRGGAPATDLGLDDQDLAAGVGMRPADDGAADRGEVPGRQQVAEVRGEAAQDQVVDADHRLRVPGERGRRQRVEDRPGTGEHAQRLEVAAVRGGVGAGDVHVGRLDGRQRRVAREVARERVLIGVVAKVDDERVVLDLDRDLVVRAVVLLLVEAELGPSAVRAARGAPPSLRPP